MGIIAKWILVVQAQPAMVAATIGPLISTAEQNMILFCCFNKGECGLTIRLEKDVFQPGEIVQLDCDVDNRARVAIANMYCNLHQNIHLLSKPSAETQTFSRKLCFQPFGGCSLKIVTTVIPTSGIGRVRDQSDAAINKGSSNAALVSHWGRVSPSLGQRH